MQPNIHSHFLRTLRRPLLLMILCLVLTGTVSAFDTSEDSGLLMLVNKSHPVAESYVPECVDLQGINSISNGRPMRKETAEAYIRMYADMAKAGITSCNVISGYRSYETQLGLVSKKVDARVAAGASRQNAYNQVTMSTAPAGCSEHQLGLALDLSTGSSSSQSFAVSAAGKWLNENCWKYGFVLRYQTGKSHLTGIVNEAWHYRYLGVPHAQILYENNWCYEEYIEYLHKHGSYTITTDEATYHIYWTQNTQTEFSDVINISGDNAGGWIITTSSAADPLAAVKGHWSESAFRALQDRGTVFRKIIDPGSVITHGDFAALLTLSAADNADNDLTREGAAKLMEDLLPKKELFYLSYADLDKISGYAFQSVQIAVSNGIFSHEAGAKFRPTDKMTWGEAAATVLRYFELMDNSDTAA